MLLSLDKDIKSLALFIIFFMRFIKGIPETFI